MMPTPVGSREAGRRRCPITPHHPTDKCDTGRTDNVEAAMSAGDADYGVHPEGEDQVPIEELARQQGVHPITSADDLARDGIWESDEELDAFIADLYASRSAGSSAP
jgi:hypothetical protein